MFFDTQTNTAKPLSTDMALTMQQINGEYQLVQQNDNNQDTSLCSNPLNSDLIHDSSINNPAAAAASQSLQSIALSSCMLPDNFYSPEVSGGDAYDVMAATAAHSGVQDAVDLIASLEASEMRDDTVHGTLDYHLNIDHKSFQG